MSPYGPGSGLPSGHACAPAPAARRRERDPPGHGGFTLLELVMAVTVATITMGGLLALTQTTSTAARDVDANLRSLQGSINALATVRTDLNRARIAAIAEDGTSITYSLPVPAGGSGAFVDDAGEILWGISDVNGVTLDGTATLAFVFDRTLSETEEARDLNGDGDQSDRFDVGRLERTSSTGARLGIPRLDVLVASGERGGDVDGDGTPDPLFSMDPAGREVVLRLARFARKARIRLFVIRCAVAERGPGAGP